MPSKVSKKKIGGKKGLPVIKCSCGKKIMLVPDAKLMGEAIEVHIATHIQEIEDSKEAEAEAERIHDGLIIQIFNKTSKS